MTHHPQVSTTQRTLSDEGKRRARTCDSLPVVWQACWQIYKTTGSPDIPLGSWEHALRAAHTRN
jgi:hypothetical protein